METLDKDALTVLALELDLPNLLSLCNSNKKINETLCNNNTFWMVKLYKEYPETKGNIPKGADYRKIYKSLKEKEESVYEVFLSFCNEDKDRNDIPPKFWPFIKKVKEMHLRTKENEGITAEDYEFADMYYPDFKIRCGEEHRFRMVGNYPSGTKIWLAYSDDRDVGLNEAFISKELAINKTMNVLSGMLNYIFELVEDGDIEIDIKDTYGYETKEEIMNSFRKELEEKGVLYFIDPNPEIESWYIVQDFTILDYDAIIEELKSKNPNWKKLPKDITKLIRDQYL